MNKSISVLTGFLTVFSLLFFSCKDQNTTNQISENKDSSQFQVKHPDWIKSANIYEVNLRQYTKTGTIKEFKEHLPRLKEMGVDILWFMPIFPNGQVNRKAGQNLFAEEIKNPVEREKYLGSPYGTKDYLSVNPKFGTLDEFKALVDTIHKMDMFIILDIAVNHTAWDHYWIKDHPEYYMRIDKGDKPWNKDWMKQHPEYFERIQKLGMTYPIHPNETDWWDTAELNFDNNDLRNEFKEIFKFWVSKTGIDGYRCDMAGLVPLDFWNDIRAELDKIKPVFMLAESEQPDHHYKAFDASYGWEFHHLTHNVAKGEKTVNDIEAYFAKDDTVYSPNANRMYFTTNHDENSWNGTEYEKYGDATKTFAVLYYTISGMPLIYNGQEAGLNKRLLFFQKDEIDWDKDKELAGFYKNLNNLKKEQSALWNVGFGAKLNRIKTDNDSKVFAFVRENEKSKVLVVINLSKEALKVKLNTNEDFNNLKNYFTKAAFAGNEMELKRWEYLVFVR